MSRTAFGFLAVALAAGCTVPPSRLGGDVNEIRGLAGRMDSAYSNEEFDAALAIARKITQLGSDAAAGVLIGDPRRKIIDEALARAREIRHEIRQRQKLKRGADRDRLVEDLARSTLEEAAAASEEVKGPPAGADIATLLDLTEGEKRKAQPVPAGLGGDVDLERHRAVASGDREGDVADDDFSPVRRAKPAKSDAPGKLVIDENTAPVTVQKIKTSGKGLAVYFTFVNKAGGPARIGSVTGTIFRETGQRVGRLLVSFEAEGFQANWDDIFSSTGKAVSAKSVGLQPMQAIQLVAVGEKPEFGTVEKAHIEVVTTDGGIHRGDGPEKK